MEAINWTAAWAVLIVFTVVATVVAWLNHRGHRHDHRK